MGKTGNKKLQGILPRGYYNIWCHACGASWIAKFSAGCNTCEHCGAEPGSQTGVRGPVGYEPDSKEGPILGQRFPIPID